jgi:hypothetical protein
VENRNLKLTYLSWEWISNNRPELFFHGFGKNKEGTYKLSSFLLATAWNFTVATSSQVYERLQINELNRLALGKGVGVRSERAGR